MPFVEGNSEVPWYLCCGSLFALEVTLFWRSLCSGGLFVLEVTLVWRSLYSEDMLRCGGLFVLDVSLLLMSV